MFFGLFVWDHMALLSLTGTTEEHIRGCLAQETTWTVILYTQHSSVLRCSDNRMTEKYQGNISFAQQFFSFMIVQPYIRPGSHCALKLDFGPNWIWFHVASTAQIPFFQEGIKPLLEVVSIQIQIQFNTWLSSRQMLITRRSARSAFIL